MFEGHLVGDVNWISSSWGTFKGHLGDVHYIPLKWGKFGGQTLKTVIGFLSSGKSLEGTLMMIIGYLPSWRHFGRDRGHFNWRPFKWGTFIGRTW